MKASACFRLPSESFRIHRRACFTNWLAFDAPEALPKFPATLEMLLETFAGVGTDGLISLRFKFDALGSYGLAFPSEIRMTETSARDVRGPTEELE
jgi:hypothetical protein